MTIALNVVNKQNDHKGFTSVFARPTNRLLLNSSSGTIILNILNLLPYWNEVGGEMCDSKSPS